MKYFKDKSTGEVFAYEIDGSQDELIGDKEPLTDQELAAHLTPHKTPQEVIIEFTNAIQNRLDEFARSRKYDNCLSCCTYATSSIQKFAEEGSYMVQARDETWSAAYVLLGQFEAGLIQQPTLNEVLAVLPELSWPLQQ